MFENCSGLKSIDLSLLDTKNVENMKGMFNGCFNLINFVSPLDTKNVTNMSSMFSDCKRLAKLDLSYLDVSKVTDTFNMFKYCSNLKKIKLNNDNYNTIEKALRWDNINPEIEA